jgi:hypothetical protein
MAGRCALCPHSTSYLSKATTVANLLEKTNPKVLKTPLRAGLKVVHFKTGQHVSRPVDRASTADRATAAAADRAAADRAAAATAAEDRAAEDRAAADRTAAAAAAADRAAADRAAAAAATDAASISAPCAAPPPSPPPSYLASLAPFFDFFVCCGGADCGGLCTSLLPEFL